MYKQGQGTGIDPTKYAMARDPDDFSSGCPLSTF